MSVEERADNGLSLRLNHWPPACAALLSLNRSAGSRSSACILQCNIGSSLSPTGDGLRDRRTYHCRGSADGRVPIPLETGIVQNVRGYMIYGDYREPHPSSAIIDAVENGDVDVAVVWGPLAGYFAAQGSIPLALAPVEPWRDGTELPMAFYISMGVRRGDNTLLQRLNDSLERNHTAISGILAEYHVPVLPDAFAPS
jgi:hypothetical protein